MARLTYIVLKIGQIREHFRGPQAVQTTDARFGGLGKKWSFVVDHIHPDDHILKRGVFFCMGGFCFAKMAAVISIAGSPGLEDSSARKSRAASDESLAETLRAGGLELFVESWYQQPLWAR